MSAIRFVHGFRMARLPERLHACSDAAESRVPAYHTLSTFEDNNKTAKRAGLPK
jgi:hypothetical protein